MLSSRKDKHHLRLYFSYIISEIKPNLLGKEKAELTEHPKEIYIHNKNIPTVWKFFHLFYEASITLISEIGQKFFEKG